MPDDFDSPHLKSAFNDAHNPLIFRVFCVFRGSSSSSLAPEWVIRAEQQLAEVIPAFEKSHLQDQPDREQVNRLLVEIREGF